MNASVPSPEIVAALQANAGDYTWALATVGANIAAGYQLATDEPVMAIGGFNGTDPSPTLAEFQALVEAGKIHYFVAGGSFGGARSTAAQIRKWVEQHFTAVSISGVNFYDLASPAS